MSVQGILGAVTVTGALVVGGLAVAAPASAAITAVASPGTVRPAAWNDTGLWFQNQGACQLWGQNDVNYGVANAYNCAYEPASETTPGYPWHLYEFAD